MQKGRGVYRIAEEDVNYYYLVNTCRFFVNTRGFNKRVLDELCEIPLDCSENLYSSEIARIFLAIRF